MGPNGFQDEPSTCTTELHTHKVFLAYSFDVQAPVDAGTVVVNH